MSLIIVDDYKWWKLGIVIGIMLLTLLLSVLIALAICSAPVRFVTTHHLYLVSFLVILQINAFCNWPMDVLMTVLPLGDEQVTPRHCQASLLVETFCYQVISLHLLLSSSTALYNACPPCPFPRLLRHRGIARILRIALPWTIGILFVPINAHLCLASGDRCACVNRKAEFALLFLIVVFALPLLSAMAIILLTAVQIRRMETSPAQLLNHEINDVAKSPNEKPADTNEPFNQRIPMIEQGTTCTENQLSKANVSCSRTAASRKAVLQVLVMCVVSMVTWSPYALSASLWTICTAEFCDCPFSISTQTLNRFKWLTYTSPLAYLIGFLFVDPSLFGGALEKCHLPRTRTQSRT
uniref:G_PROTEIN_RECEP_F1_2 domain-containing protein n=1 Tax=Mesocestoides corti TaxID=53468 RepID=A0A5K3F7T7_MESCO